MCALVGCEKKILPASDIFSETFTKCAPHVFSIWVENLRSRRCVCAKLSQFTWSLES